MARGITVREALTTRGFEESRVLAGQAGLDNLVKTVTVAEVPDAMDWLTGGELVITTAYYIKENPLAQERWVKGLLEHGAVALAIKPARFIGTIPDSIKKIGDELAFPIIELPMSVTWPVIIESVMNLIIDRQSTLLKRSEEIHKRLTRLVLDSRGLDAIARTVSDLVGNPVIIEDRWFNVLATGQPAETKLPVILHRLSADYVRKLKTLPEISAVKDQNHKTFIRTTIAADQGQYRQYILPIFAGEVVYGFLSVLEINTEVLDKDFIAMEHGSTVIALEFLKRRATFEAEERLRADLLRTLLEEMEEGEEEVKQKAAVLGLDLSDSMLVIIIKVESRAGMGPGQGPAGLEGIDARVSRLVSRLVQEKDPRSFVVTRHDDLVVFYHPTGRTPTKLAPPEAKEIAGDLWRILGQEFHRAGFIIGIGNPCDDIKEIRRSYAEAQAAVNVGRSFPVYGPVVPFSELGYYRLLSMVKDRAGLENYCRDTIGKIIEYQNQNQADLLSTLENYLLANGNQAGVARRMFLHVNTVAYRIKKIEQLLNVDLSQAEMRFNLYLALKVFRSL